MVQQHELKLIEKTLIKTTTIEVEKAIESIVMPNIKKIIKECAAEATKDWIVRYKEYKNSADDPFNTITNIKIDFVENVVKTVMKENDIKIEVAK